MWCNGKFKESESPITALVLSEQILRFATKSELLVYLILAFADEYVAVDIATFLLDDALVVLLVLLHEVDVKRFCETLFEVYVEVLIVNISHLEEGVLDTVGTASALEIVVLKTLYERVVYLYLHAILAAKGSLALEVVSKSALECPLTFCLCSVWIECSERICLVESKCREMVDVTSLVEW